MAAKKPLALYGGEVQQLQAGDTLDASVSEVDVVGKTAADDLIAGQAVYSSSATEVDLAKADADATAKPIGLATAAASSAAAAVIQTDGILTLTTGEWDALCGTTGGLAFGTRYYLSGATAGLLTATAPSTTGHYVLAVMVGLSTTEGKIFGDWTRRIKL